MTSDNDTPDGSPESGASQTATAGPGSEGFQSRRQAVRLTTVFGGRICQYGKAYACVISDVSAGGAKVRLKDPHDFPKITKSGEVQLVFERLSDYKALNTEVAWLKPDEKAIGLRFIDPELRRRMVIKKLMPTRWKIASEQAQVQAQAQNGPAQPDDDEAGS